MSGFVAACSRTGASMRRRTVGEGETGLAQRDSAIRAGEEGREIVLRPAHAAGGPGSRTGAGRRRRHSRAGERQLDRGRRGRRPCGRPWPRRCHGRPLLPPQSVRTRAGVRLALGAVGQQVDRQRQAVEGGEEGAEVGVGAVALARDGDEEVRAKAGPAAAALPGAHASRPCPASRYRARRRRAWRPAARPASPAPARWRADRPPRGSPCCRGPGALKPAASALADRGTGLRCRARCRGRAMTASHTASASSRFLQAASKRRRSREVCCDRGVVEGGDRELALPDPARAEEDDRVGIVVEDGGDEAFQLLLPADEAAFGGDAGGGRGRGCGLGAHRVRAIAGRGRAGRASHRS